MKTGRLITPLVLSLTALISLWFLFHLEAVEAQALEGVAVINVDTTADDNVVNGNCTLREAVISANTGATTDVCDPGGPQTEIYVPAGTYALTIGGTDEDAAATGDLDLQRKGSISIFGAGARDTIIDGGGLDRVFHVVYG
jgi:CSLREA domain-containing protein